MTLHCYTAALFLTFSTTCSTHEGQSATTQTAPRAIASGQTTTTPVHQATNDDEIQERGLLKAVEDGGYPFATLTIEFPERTFSESFTINLGDVKNVTMDDLNKAIGSYVSFGYTSQMTNALLDIQQDGKSLLGDDAPTLQPDTKQILGKLRGANKETTSDEPATIRITTDDNTTETFQYFVTKEMVAANGKTVLAYFERRTANTIKSLKILPK